MSEKHDIFSDMAKPSQDNSGVPRPKPGRRGRGESIDAAIRAQIAGAPAGKVFTPTDFIHLGSRAAVDKVLSRMVSGGELRRIGRGLYDRPQRHHFSASFCLRRVKLRAPLQGKEVCAFSLRARMQQIYLGYPNRFR